jgi:hypothetical protein
MSWFEVISIARLTVAFSGAGKTVSAKYIMRYFATADDKESSDKKKKADTGGMTEVEEQILGNVRVLKLWHLSRFLYF